MLRMFISATAICTLALGVAACGDSEMTRKIEAGKAKTFEVMRPLCGKKVDIYGFHNCLGVVEAYEKITKRHRYGLVVTWNQKNGDVGIFWENATVRDIDSNRPLYGPHSRFCGDGCDSQLLGVYALDSVQGKFLYKHFLEQG
jgi:hypothetical protein